MSLPLPFLLTVEDIFESLFDHEDNACNVDDQHSQLPSALIHQLRRKVVEAKPLAQLSTIKIDYLQRALRQLDAAINNSGRTTLRIEKDTPIDAEDAECILTSMDAAITVTAALQLRGGGGCWPPAALPPPPVLRRAPVPPYSSTRRAAAPPGAHTGINNPPAPALRVLFGLSPPLLAPLRAPGTRNVHNRRHAEAGKAPTCSVSRVLARRPDQRGRGASSHGAPAPAARCCSSTKRTSSST